MSMAEWRSPADLRGGTAPSVAAGGLIRTGGNFHPYYQVVALSEDRAWVRDLQYGTDHVIPVEDSRKIQERRMPSKCQEPLCN